MKSEGKTAGSKWTFIREVPSILKLVDQILSESKSELFCPSKLLDIPLFSTSLKSKPLISHEVKCGSFLEMEMRSTSPLSGSIQTVADFVRLMRHVSARSVFYQPRDGALSVFSDYSALNNAGGILSVLGPAPKLPTDIWPITTQYLVRLRQSNLNLVPQIDSLLSTIMMIELKADSILHRASRGFAWMERPQKIRTRNMPAEAQPIKTWIAQSYIKDVPKSVYDGVSGAIRITEFKLLGQTVFAWQVGLEGKVIDGMGFEDSLENAAEMGYKSFYKAVTNYEFAKAKQFRPSDEVVVFGQEVSAEEFKITGGTVLFAPGTDDRNDKLFIVSLGRNDTKKTFIIESITKDQSSIKLKGGSTIDTAFSTVYVKCPEQYIATEVACAKCCHVSIPFAVAGKYSRVHGYLCGPCVEYLSDTGELSEYDID